MNSDNANSALAVAGSTAAIVASYGPASVAVVGAAPVVLAVAGIAAVGGGLFWAFKDKSN